MIRSRRAHRPYEVSVCLRQVPESDVKTGVAHILARGLWIVFVASNLLACGQSETAATGNDADAGRGPDATKNDSDAMSGSDTGTYSDAGTYMQGTETCCGEGRGLSCCTADAGLLGYNIEPDGAITAVGARSDGTTEANCFLYGGSGACTKNGDSFDRKQLCSICCAGLSATTLDYPDDAGTCLGGGPVSLVECLPCGDGKCDPGENRCNCPADCK